MDRRADANDCHVSRDSPTVAMFFCFLPSFVIQASLEELMEGGTQSSLSVYDESALCSSAFK